MSETAPIALASLGFAVVVSAVFLRGLLVRRKPRIGQVGLDSILVLGLFAGSLAVYYVLR